MSVADPLVLSPVSLAGRDDVDHVAVGIVGCGFHSITGILPSLRHAGLRLVAACDRDLSRAEWATRQFGGQAAYRSFEQLLARDDVEAVIVVGPPELHVQAGVAALESGRHVFVEKPPGNSLGGALQLRDAARRAERQAMVGFMKRRAAAYRLLAQVIAEPEFGRLTSVNMTYSAWPVADLRDHLTDMSIHALDMVRWLLGNPVRMAIYKRLVADRHVVSLTIEHLDGGVSQLDLTAFQPGLRDCLVATGEDAVVVVENHLRLTYTRQGPRGDLPPWAPNTRLTRSWSPELALPDPENDMQVLMGYAPELIEFGAAIRCRREASPSIEDGVAAMRMIEAIIAAPEGLSIAEPL